MDKSMDFNYGGFPPYGMEGYPTDSPENSMFNPLFQYEQAYMYYRYLTMQLEYKMKCKEYEKLCSNGRNERDRKIE